MLNRTHISIGVFYMILFIPKVVHVYTYIIVFLISTLLPNLDSFFSGKSSLFMRPVGLILKKNGFLHSFTFCFIISGILTWSLPILAFPFFMGYGLHLLIDAWTAEGIKPFWPFRYVSKGRLKTGGNLEDILFYSFIVADLVAVFFYFY